MRTVVVHPHNAIYARAVADDLHRHDEASALHPAAWIADEDAAAAVADAWLDVADRLVVYGDHGEGYLVERTMRTAEILGMPIEVRHLGGLTPKSTLSDRIRAWLA